MTRVVSLVDVDPDLTAGIPDDDVELARRVLARPRYDVPQGAWTPELLGAHDNGAFAVLVVSGLVFRQVDLADRHCAQVLGAGDVLQTPRADGVLDCAVTWTVAKPTSVVVLDARFTRAAQRWPQLAVNLHQRLLDQNDRALLHAATAQLARVDRRVLALFWQLADRWGRVTPFGVELPIELTHEMIGRLAGAQRPTVSLALRDLGEEGTLQRLASGRWMLDPGSRHLLRAAEPRHAVPVSG